MGLDMTVFTMEKEPATPIDFDMKEATELHYWRKHPNLHGWMEQLYFHKGGELEFNVTPVQLTEEDIDRLEADIVWDKLPETEGFFFGASTGEEKADDLAFINKARRALNDGLYLAYSSWW